jgi:hypothetical protein
MKNPNKARIGQTIIDKEKQMRGMIIVKYAGIGW